MTSMAALVRPMKCGSFLWQAATPYRLGRHKALGSMRKRGIQSEPSWSPSPVSTYLGGGLLGGSPGASASRLHEAINFSSLSAATSQVGGYVSVYDGTSLIHLWDLRGDTAVQAIHAELVGVRLVQFA